MVKMLGVSHKHNVKMSCCPRVATPAYDTSQLKAALDGLVLKTGVKRCFDLGAYQHISVSGGANGAGLLYCRGLLTCLLGASKFALFKVGDLKQILVELAQTYSGLNPGKQDNHAWATSLSERMMVVLNHLRRLKNSEVRVRQACRKMDMSSQAKLQDLVQVVGLMDAKVEKSDTPKDDMDGSFAQGLQLDDLEEDIKVCVPVPPSKNTKGFAKHEVSKPAAKSTCKAVKSADTGVAAKDISFSATYGTNQSYIQFQCKGMKGKKLLVAVSAKQCHQHTRVVKVMFHHFQKNPTTDKAKALSLRAALLG